MITDDPLGMMLDADESHPTQATEQRNVFYVCKTL